MIHGSYSPAHVLCAPAGTTVVIDWENADSGPMWRDVGHFLAALKVWGTGNPQHVAWFLDGVRDGRPLDAPEQDEIGDWEAFTCLVWADHFLRQGQTALSERILSVAGLAGRGQQEPGSAAQA